MESNKPTYDPSVNVRELVEAAMRRLDDLADVREKHIHDKIKDKDVQYQFQFTAAEKAIGIALIAQEKQVAAALEGTKEAINKADINTDKRFSLLSEKIDGITMTMNKSTGERGIYVTHTDLNIAMDKLQVSIEATLRPVVTFMNSYKGGEKQINNIWGYIVGAIGIVSGIILVILRFSGK